MRSSKRVLAPILAGVLALALFPTRAGGTGFASDNVTHIRTVPTEAGYGTGGRLLGKYFYVAGAKSFSIYDVSTPEDPTLMSITPFGGAFPVEDVDTNGKILLIQDEQGAARPQGGKLSIY